MHTQNEHVTNIENARKRQQSKHSAENRVEHKTHPVDPKRQPFIKHNIKNSRKSSMTVRRRETGESERDTNEQLIWLDFQWWLKLLTASSNTSEGRSYWLCRYEWSYATHQARSVGMIKNFLCLSMPKRFSFCFLFVSSLKIADEWISMNERLEVLGDVLVGSSLVVASSVSTSDG